MQGLEEDLGMEGNQFNIAVSVLFVGYILGQIPSNLILSRVRPSLYLSLFVALWGAVSTCTAAADNFNHLVVLRFFLGVTEGTSSRHTIGGDKADDSKPRTSLAPCFCFQLGTPRK